MEQRLNRSATVKLSDKDVGELWHMLIKPETSNLAREESLSLIRKLVEANVQCLTRFKADGYYPRTFDPLKTTLDRYGIDPSTWG